METTYQKCRWFALCGNEATTTEPHPILGDVPICDRCAAKVEGLKPRTSRTIRADELTPGMEVWIGSAWSSNGMKAGYWFRIEEVSFNSYWDTGQTVDIGATELSISESVTIR